MSIIHLECKPDEFLVKKLGVVRKDIRHHSDKSRVYTFLKNNDNCIAMVDEDPNPDPNGPKHPYENQLTFVEEQHGIKRYVDNKLNNVVLVLTVKLEDWIVFVCRKSGVDMTKPPYSLPNKANNLHKVINDRFPAYEKLLDDLLAKNNEPLLLLKLWLNKKNI